jgi:hypothetical protein
VNEREHNAIDRALDLGDGAPFDEDALGEYREALAHMPLDEVAPPRGLEERVMSAALAKRPTNTVSLERAAVRRRARARVAVLGAVAVAAALVVAVLLASRGATTAPRGNISEVATGRSDVDTLLHQPGTRTGTFGGSDGAVVLAADGNGDVYGVANRPVVVELENSAGHVTSLGTAEPHDGVIAFTVDRPDRVRAVILRAPDGRDVARAALSPS